MVLLVSVVAIVLFPLYVRFVQYPAFERLLTENTTREAERIATTLSNFLLDEQDHLSSAALPPHFARHVRELLKDSRILKLKIFTPDGRIIYSTDPNEIGRFNKEDYFRTITKTGANRTEQVAKDRESLEREIMSADVVETYVPINKQGRMIGVFEIYYDISSEKQKLKKLVNRSSGALFILAVLLLSAVIVAVAKASRTMEERMRIEKILMENEQRYRTLFEHAGDGIFILEAEGEQAGQIVEVNAAAAVLHGYSIEEIKSMKITDLDTPDAAQDAPGLIKRMRSGEWVKTELTHKKKDGTRFSVEVSAGLFRVGDHTYILAFDRDITARRQAERGREKLIRDLQDALDKIRKLRGMLPICASCKKIRDDKGYWNQIEAYISAHSEAEFTHGLCPDCAQKLYPGMGIQQGKDKNKM